MIRLDDPCHVGAIIADLRAMSRLTQRQICDATGMHEARLSDWERGAAIPTPCRTCCPSSPTSATS